MKMFEKLKKFNEPDSSQHKGERVGENKDS